jgi:hypothetical protein
MVKAKGNNMRKKGIWRTGILVLAAGFAFAGTVTADPLVISMTGVDYVWDGTTLCDAGNGGLCNTPPGAPNTALADDLQSLDLFFPSPTPFASFGALDGIFVDFSLPPTTTPITADGTTANPGTGGHLDIFLNDTWALALNLASWNLFVGPIGSGILGVGSVASIFDQNLPDGLVAGLPINFVLTGLVTGGTLPDTFTAVGVGSVSAEANIVPEPASLLLLGSGLTGLAVRYRRRQQKA